jgi:MFS family permease
VAAVGFTQATVAYMMAVAIPLTILRLGGAAYVVGLGMTAWALGRSVMGLWGGRQYDRIGGRRGLTLGFALFAAAAVGYAIAPTPAVLVLVRLVQGVGAGLYWSVMLSVAGGTQMAATRLRRLSVFNALVSVGGIVGSLLGGWLMAFGIHVNMGVAAVLCVGLVAVAVRIPQGGSAPASRPAAHPAGPSAGPLSSGRLARTALIVACSQLPAILSVGALPVLLVRAGLSAQIIGVEYAVIVGGTLLGQAWLFARAHSLSSRRALHALYVLLAAGLTVFLAFSGVAALMVELAVVGISVQLLATVWVNEVQIAAGQGRVGSATGVVRATSDFLSAATFPLVGVVEEYLAAAAGLLLAIVAASGVVVWRSGAALLGSPPLYPSRPRAAEASGHDPRHAG